MKELKTVEDLAKAAGQLAGHFTKNAAFHTAAAGHHNTMKAHHEGQAAFHKAAHDAMDDGHEMKAHVGKVHEHHVAKAAHHGAMAAAHETYAEDSNKIAAAFGSEPEVKKTEAVAVVTGEGNDIMTLLKQAFSDNIAAIKDSPEFKEMVKGLAMDQVRALFGNKVNSDGARKIFGENPPTSEADRLQLVHRAGGGPTAEEKGQVNPEMEDALAI